MKLRIGLCFILLSAPLLAQKLTLQLDPHATSINWTLNDVLHHVNGNFQLQQGTVTYDPATGVAAGLIVVSAASGESGNAARDRKMRKEELQTDRFPEIIFRPQHATGTLNPSGDSNLAVTGIFTLDGRDHPLTMNVVVHRLPGTITADTTFDLPYVAWGLKDPSTFILRVGKSVHIQVRSTATVSGR